MKPALWPIIPLLISGPLLIRAELNKNQRQIYLLKPISSASMILVALLALLLPNRNDTYLSGILIGLILSFIGDMLLMFPGNKRFLLSGLIVFLLGHVAYTITFLCVGRVHVADLASLAVLAVLAVLVFVSLRPNLGAMQIPVGLYIAVISLMVNRAIATLYDPTFATAQGWMIAIGALLFYISDLILAYGRFGKPLKYHRISLAFYYTGQVLIGLSASYF
ncbi:MAG: lysoplasmalogenase [Anaerolineae bacterium]|nr:lysoplasmalogenase [Anaerolineae bacterium]